MSIVHAGTEDSLSFSLSKGVARVSLSTLCAVEAINGEESAVQESVFLFIDRQRAAREVGYYGNRKTRRGQLRDQIFKRRVPVARAEI